MQVLPPRINDNLCYETLPQVSHAHIHFQIKLVLSRQFISVSSLSKGVLQSIPYVFQLCIQDIDLEPHP